MHPMQWLPFGAGPRNCLGLQFALLETKIALARIIKRFKMECCEQTCVPPELDGTILLKPKDGVCVKIIPRG